MSAVLAGTAGCVPPDRSQPRIVVTEIDGPFSPLAIRLTGLSPGDEVVLDASSELDSVEYRSQATFVADESGTVDLDRRAPSDDAWTTASSMAPFWSLAPRLGSPARFDAYAEPYDVELRVTAADGTALASTVVARGADLEAVTVEDVVDDGLVAAYARPQRSDSTLPAAAVLVIGGSEGGLDTARMLARWIAAAGYPALAVSYFGSPGQATELADVPLETFITAAGWLASRIEVDPERVAALGVSRGGEAAVWLATEHPELVHGAIAPVGAGEFWCGYPDWRRSAWTLDGVPVPCAADPARIPDAAVIDLDSIGGPLVLACGDADAVWDSCALMARTVERAEAARIDVTQLVGDGASHYLAFDPYLPALPGTDAAADAQARAEFWARAFEALGPPVAR